MVAGRWPTKSVGGIATTGMLAAAGITGRALTAAIERHMVLRLHKGAYIQCVVWAALKPWERESAVLTAHVLASHGQGVYSHSSAARLLGLATWACGSTIHVTHGFAPGVSARGAHVKVHQQRYAPGQVTMVQHGPLRVPVTGMAQTVLDCGRLFSLEQSVVIGDSALRKRLDPDALRGLLEASPIKRGAARAGTMLAHLDARSESAGESRTRIFLVTSRLPMPELQLEIPTRHGLHRVDFAWREFRLILEFDGWGKYFNYRPTAEAVAQERQREKDLMELGWRFIRIAWQDLNEPVALEARIRGALAAAGARLPWSRTAVFP